MPQPRHDHPDDGDLNVGPRLVEHEEIEAGAPGDIHAGVDLPAGTRAIMSDTVGL